MTEKEIACAMCKKSPPTGHAGINDKRFCHGDTDRSPTCYEKAQRNLDRWTK